MFVTCILLFILVWVFRIATRLHDKIVVVERVCVTYTCMFGFINRLATSACIRTAVAIHCNYWQSYSPGC